jgi:hypothetical protein
MKLAEMTLEINPDELTTPSEHYFGNRMNGNFGNCLRF